MSAAIEESAVRPPGAVPTREPARVAVIGLSHPSRGGIAHYSTMLVRSLRRRRPVRFITLRRQFPSLFFPGRTELDHSAQPLSEHCEPLLDGADPRTWMRVIRTLRDGDYEVLILQSWNTFLDLVFGVIANAVVRTSRVRICVLCHNVERHEPMLLDAPVMKFAYRKAERFIVHSREDEIRLREMLPGADVKLNPIPTYSVFTDFGRYSKGEARRALGLPEDDRIVLFFGVVRAYKGLNYLVEAMDLVNRELSCRLLVVGEFYQSRRHYDSLFRRPRPSDRLTIVDRYVANEEVPLYFYAADVVVLPYVQASQSAVLQTAFGLGRPVIATRVGGFPDVVRHRRTGMLVEPSSASAIAEAILEYFRGGYERPFREAIEADSERFDWDVLLSNVTGFEEEAAIG